MKNAFFLCLKAIAFWIVLLLNQNVLAQKKQGLDSLKKVIKSGISLEEKAKTYNKLAITYYNISLDSAIKYANQSILFSSQYKLYTSLATAYNYLGQFMYAKGDYKLSLLNFEKFRNTAVLQKKMRFFCFKRLIILPMFTSI